MYTTDNVFLSLSSAECQSVECAALWVTIYLVISIITNIIEGGGGIERGKRKRDKGVRLEERTIEALVSQVSKLKSRGNH